MSWIAQVGHVMRKDLRESRWPLIGYIAVVAIITLAAIQQGSVADRLDFGATVVVALAMVVLSMIIQSDSPTREDAFWASRPFYPSAVFAAKVALAVLIAVLPLVGQLAALSAYEIPVARVLGSLLTPIRVIALWFLFAMVTAALTRDFRTFVAALAVLPLLFLASLWVLGSSLPWQVNEGLAVALRVLVGGGAVALLWFLYQTRDGRLGRWAMLLFAGACAMVLASAPYARAVHTNRDAPPELPRVRVAVQVLNLSEIATSPRLQVKVTAASPVSKAELLQLAEPVVVMQLRDGSTLRMPAEHQIAQLGSAPSVRGLPSTVSVGVIRASLLSIDLSAQHRRALAAGVRSIALEGRVFVSSPHLVATMALREGSSLTLDGTRQLLERWSHDQGKVSVDLTTTSVALGNDFGAWRGGPQPDFEFVLTNDSRRETVRLNSGSSTSGSGWLVLPGTSLVRTTRFLKSQQEFGITPSIELDDEWLRSARLAMIGWTSYGSYPVRAEATLR